ncbi:MAG: hypothetical protein AAFU56_04450 [Pseudomonadota bacterium]
MVFPAVMAEQKFDEIATVVGQPSRIVTQLRPAIQQSLCVSTDTLSQTVEHLVGAAPVLGLLLEAWVRARANAGIVGAEICSRKISGAAPIPPPRPSRMMQCADASGAKPVSTVSAMPGT